MSEAPGTVGSTCPACGLAVATGYLKCPKCHAALPNAPTHGGDARAKQVQGGTSVQSGGNGWVYAVGGAAVVAAVLVFVLSRGGDDGQTRVVGAKAAPADVDQAPPITAAAPDPAGPAVAAGGAPTPRVDERVNAARLLMSRLESARMWSTVEVTGDGLAIKSAYCDEPEVAATLDAVAADLVEAGVATVTCYERHGPKVFDRALVAAP